MTPWALGIVAAVLYGLAIGSFTNVIIDRLPRALAEPNEFGETWETRPWAEVLGGRSRCSTCGAEIRVVDNIPVVSYLALRGRCRGCAERIPAFHPVVELAVPLLAVLAVWAIGPHPELWIALWLVPVGVAIATIDLRTLIVPTRLVWPAFFVTVAISAGIVVHRVVTDVDSPARPLLGAVIGVAVLAGPLFAIWWIHPRGMGFGDVRLSVLLGWSIGFVALLVGTRLVEAVFLTVIALAIAAGMGLTLGIALQVGFGRQVPFGPGLIGGALVAIMLADGILAPF